MKLKDRIKTYNFWVSLASAILLIVNLIGKRFNFSVDENLYNDLFTSFCGILVLLGIIVPPNNSKNLSEGINENSKTEEQEDISGENEENNFQSDNDSQMDCDNSKNSDKTLEYNLQNKQNFSEKIDKK